MANFVKISLLSQPSLSHSPFSEDLESKVQEMLSYLKRNLDQVLPDQPDLIVVPEACDRYPSFTMEQRKRYYQYRGIASGIFTVRLRKKITATSLIQPAVIFQKKRKPPTAIPPRLSGGMGRLLESMIKTIWFLPNWMKGKLPMGQRLRFSSWISAGSAAPSALI